MGILQLISARNFITVNKDLIKLLGLEEAILLGELASEHDYWETQDKLEDGYFYSTVENIENHTTLSDHKQRKAIKNLKSKNLIDVKVKGIPAKRYIKINEEQVFELFNLQFLKNSRTRDEKIEEQGFKNSKTNNNILNNNKINNNIDNNIINSNDDINYEKIVGRLNELTGASYWHDSKNTRTLIKARFKEGFTEEDFITVIDKMCYLWNREPKKGQTDMRLYLRPSTLFGTKFEQYLNMNITKVELTTKDLASKLDFSDFYSNEKVSDGQLF